MHKLFRDLALLLPTRKKRVFFIYTHNNATNRFQNGLTANTEISHWSQVGLRQADSPIHFLRLQGEKAWRLNQIRPQDIVIGHTGETYRKACARTKNVIVFQPWSGHADRSSQNRTNCTPKEIELEDYAQARSIIFLTSEFNVGKYVQRPTNFWYDFCRSNRVRCVHQPLDLTCFPRIKTSYQTSDFLYIGNDLHMKCLDDSRRLVKESGRTLTTYGVDGKKISNLDQKAIAQLAKLADFFIQPGMWEAQCVSILEAAARGFIPVVSPETGYPYEHPYLLRYGDHAYNLERLRALLKTSPEERKELADHLHAQLVSDPNHNSWEHLTSALVEEVKQLMLS